LLNVSVSLYFVVVNSYPDLDDQSVFWIRIRNRTQTPPVLPLDHCGHFDNATRTGKELVTCALDGCIFAAGALRGVAYDWLRDNLRDKKEKVVTVHANYLKGNELKRNALQKHGYWIVRQNGDGSYTDGNCAPFTPNL
jgi:hypothetical protein